MPHPHPQASGKNLAWHFLDEQGNKLNHRNGAPCPGGGATAFGGACGGYQANFKASLLQCAGLSTHYCR